MYYVSELVAELASLVHEGLFVQPKKGDPVYEITFFPNIRV